MESHVAIGDTGNLPLKSAILLYRKNHFGGGDFATLHDIVETGRAGAPQLGPAKPLGTSFLMDLGKQLGQGAAIELLPENVLVSAPGTMIWWTPPAMRRMWWRNEAAPLNGKRFPQPALLWCVSDGRLSVRALMETGRPSSKARLCVAPYWNTDPRTGSVCTGSMRAPAELNVASMGKWESAFWESEFTHQMGAGKMTEVSGGLVEAWTKLKGKKEFPCNWLVATRTTLAGFVDNLRGKL